MMAEEKYACLINVDDKSKKAYKKFKTAPYYLQAEKEKKEKCKDK